MKNSEMNKEERGDSEMEYMCAQCSNDIDDLSPFQDEDAYFCSQACLEEFKNEEDSEQEEEDLTDEEK
jgi:hypothetical protein